MLNRLRCCKSIAFRLSGFPACWEFSGQSARIFSSGRSQDNISSWSATMSSGHSLNSSTHSRSSWGKKSASSRQGIWRIGYGLTTLTGGQGDPFTFKKFLVKSLAPDKFFGGGLPGTPDYSGNGHSEVDFTYRIPRLRNWLTLYADGFNQDEPSPLLGTWTKPRGPLAFTFPPFRGFLNWIFAQKESTATRP